MNLSVGQKFEHVVFSYIILTPEGYVKLHKVRLSRVGKKIFYKLWVTNHQEVGRTYCPCRKVSRDKLAGLQNVGAINLLEKNVRATSCRGDKLSGGKILGAINSCFPFFAVKSLCKRHTIASKETN